MDIDGIPQASLSTAYSLVFGMANGSMILSFAAEEHEERNGLWMLFFSPTFLFPLVFLQDFFFFHFGYVFYAYQSLVIDCLSASSLQAAVVKHSNSLLRGFIIQK